MLRTNLLISDVVLEAYDNYVALDKICKVEFTEKRIGMYEIKISLEDAEPPRPRES